MVGEVRNPSRHMKIGRYRVCLLSGPCGLALHPSLAVCFNLLQQLASAGIGVLACADSRPPRFDIGYDKLREVNSPSTVENMLGTSVTLVLLSIVARHTPRRNMWPQILG